MPGAGGGENGQSRKGYRVLVLQDERVPDIHCHNVNILNATECYTYEQLSQKTLCYVCMCINMQLIR